MSSLWKSPHGSDAMPEMVVKIIGSKHFRYLVEKPKMRDLENLKVQSAKVLQKFMTGNTGTMSKDPPVATNHTDHQINHAPNDMEESKHPKNNQQPEENRREIENSQQLLTEGLNINRSTFLDGKIHSQAKFHCSSVPSGDRSLSYIHGLHRRDFRDWTLEQMVQNNSDQPEDIGQRPSRTIREDTFLLALVQRELKSRPVSSGLLEKLQKELKILDPISSGFLLQSQLSHLFLRHEVPLQLPTIKILCQRFSQQGSPEMVNYGKLLWFLKVATSDGPQQSKRDEESNLRKIQDHNHQHKSAAPQNPNSQSEVNQTLLEILKMALKSTSGELNIENLNLSFRKEDRSFSGYLPLPKVRAICGKHGLYLTLSFLETLLSHQDLGYHDEIKWQRFVELLNRASSDLPSALLTEKNKKETLAIPVSPEVPKMSHSRTGHTKTPVELLQPENPLAETLPPNEPLSTLKIRPVSQPFVTPVMNSGSEECEAWIDRFRKLENALYLCDLSHTGVLEKERARRLIHNYNLIYNLSLSPRKIDQALRRFRVGENMLLEPALRYLKEL